MLFDLLKEKIFHWLCKMIILKSIRYSNSWWSNDVVFEFWENFATQWMQYTIGQLCGRLNRSKLEKRRNYMRRMVANEWSFRNCDTYVVCFGDKIDITHENTCCTNNTHPHFYIYSLCKDAFQCLATHYYGTSKILSRYNCNLYFLININIYWKKS